MHDGVSVGPVVRSQSGDDPVVLKGDVRGGSELTLVAAVVVYARSVGSVCGTDNGD